MTNELAQTQSRRYNIIRDRCDEILKLEQSKWDLRKNIEQSNRHIAAGHKSNSKLNPTEEDKGWAANIGQARASMESNKTELEKIKDRQKEAIRKISEIVDL